MLTIFTKFLGNRKFNNKIFSFLIFSFLIFIFAEVLHAETTVNVSGLTNGLSFLGDTLQLTMIGIAKLIISVSSMILYVSGVVFDNLLAIGLSTELLNSDFVKIAWSNIRDLTNSVFIIGALAIAFSMVFDYGNWKKTMIMLIVAIFVLNFSLFVSRVIVDMGNITANVFLSSMSVTIDEPKNHFAVAKAFYKDNVNVEDFRSVAGAIAMSVQPIELLSGNNLKKWFVVGNAETKYMSFFFMAVAIAFTSMLLAKHLFVGGFMFLSRLIWIMFYMIVSPFAVASVIIPGQENTWKTKWLIPLAEKSFCIVAYLFFIWLALLIFTADFMGNIGETGFLMTITIYIIKAIFMIQILNMGNKLGSKMCENGKSLLGGLAGQAFNMVTKNPALAMVRTATGKVGKGISRLGKKGRSSNSTTRRFLSERVSLFGKGMQDIKINKQSYKDDQNKRVKKMIDIEQDMSPEDVEKRRLAQLGKSKGEGLNAGDIKSFVDVNKQERWKAAQIKAEQGDKSDQNKMLKDVKTTDVMLKKGPLGVVGSVAASFIPQLASIGERHSESEETKKDKQQKNIKIKEKEEVRKERDQKVNNFDNAAENGGYRELIQIAKENEVGNKMVTELEKVVKEMEDLGDIAARRERYELATEFNQSDWKSGDLNKETNLETKQFLENSDHADASQVLKSMMAGDTSEDVKSMLGDILSKERRDLKGVDKTEKRYNQATKNISSSMKAKNKFQTSKDVSYVDTANKEHSNKQKNQMENPDVTSVDKAGA